MTSTASACDVPTGRCEMLTGSSSRAIPSVAGKPLFGPPRLQAIPATATTIAATNSAPDEPRRVVAISTPVMTPPTASPPTVWMRSSRTAVPMWASDDTPEHCHRSPWENSCVSLVLGITHHAGVRLAEVGFLLLLIAGVWLAASEFLDPQGWGAFRRVVAGIALAVSGVLLIIAAHWGHFG